MRRFCCIAAVVLAGVATYFVTTNRFHRLWSTLFKLDPVIEYPSELDLGDHEIGDQVVFPFTITNRGGAELVIDEITSNCGCTGMEREIGGRYLRPESLRMKAREVADLVMRVTVPANRVGLRMVNVVEFRTNDPTHPLARIEATIGCVSGGVFTSPDSVVFGAVPAGATFRRVVDIWDPAVSPRAIDQVTSSSPSRVSVRLSPVEDGRPQNGPREKCTLVGRLEVTVNTNIPGHVKETVKIHVSGRSGRPDIVTILGRVAAPFELTPSVIVLPRVTSTNEVFDAVCDCRSTLGRPFMLTVASVPDGFKVEPLKVEPLGESNWSLQKFRIQWLPSKGTPLKQERHIIRLHAKDGQTEADVELPVIIRPSAGLRKEE